MPTGAFNEYLDVAQVVLYVFWFFFFGLIFYLRREDRREGYPVEPTDRERVSITGREKRDFRTPPHRPKWFKLRNGEKTPSGRRDTREVKAVPANNMAGAPLIPTGDPMLDGVGPAAYAERADEPDLDLDGEPKIVPLAAAGEMHLEARDPDPRGMTVVGADRKVAGKVTEVWVDRMESLVRYLELQTTGDAPRRVLLPINFARIHGRARRIEVRALLAAQFANVPALAKDGQITLLEEDKVMAYYGGGTLYATPDRAEPLV